MDIVSIVFIVIMALFIFFGIFKGFLRSVLSFSKSILSFLVAILLCNPIANLVQGFPFAQDGEQGILTWLVEKNTIFGETFYPTDRSKVIDALKSLSIPEFLDSFLADKIMPNIPADGIALGDTLSHLLMNILLTIICFIVLFIIARLILMILRKFIKSILDHLPAIRLIDRLLGLVFGAVMGICVVSLLCIGITGIMSVPFFGDFANTLTEQMALGTEEFRISKFIYENNPLLYIFSLFF